MARKTRSAKRSTGKVQARARLDYIEGGPYPWRACIIEGEHAGIDFCIDGLVYANEDAPLLVEFTPEDQFCKVLDWGP